MPTSTDPDAPTMQHRVTANPLMLSMVASVFEIRKGLGMPKTVVELYASASDAMLARGGVVTAEVRTLLEVVFFEAHVAQARVITDVQLLRAALGAFAPPETLADLDARVVYPFQTFKGRPEKGHYVELLYGERKGQRGVIVEDDKSSNPYKVQLADGATTGEVNHKQLASSGLDEAACRAQMARADAERLPALDRAVQALRDEVRAAVAEVRERVGQDRLPLLSLLQVEPLQMQSAHLSFQDFFAANAICSGKYRLPEGSPPPWQWPAFWANAVTLGSEMGDCFGRGLLHAAGVTGDTLDLSDKLTGGNRSMTVAAVAQLMCVLASLSLRTNKLTDGEGLKMFATLQTNKTLTQLDLGDNELGEESGKAMVEALKTNTTLTQLDLGGNKLGAESGKAMAEALKTNTTLTQLSLNGNKLGDAGSCALAVALQTNTTLRQLDLGGNKLGEKSSKAMAEALKTNTTLTQLSLNGNELGDAGSCVLSVALQTNTTLRQLDLGGNKLGEESSKAMAEALKTNTTLTQLSLNGNKLGDAGSCVLSVALQTNTTLRQLDLGDNELGEESGKAIVEALKTNTTFGTVALDGAVLSITELTLLENLFDVESATMLAKIGVEKGIMLSGMKRDQMEATFIDKSFQPADVILILSDLQFMANLTEVRLDWCGIGAEGAILIAEALKVNAAFTVLWLSGNGIGDEGAKAIAEALKVNAVLIEIVLWMNGIGDEGAKAIAEALKVNPVLTSLRLFGNSIGDEGVKAIAEALKVNSVLTILSLDKNDFGDEGAKAIADALQSGSAVLTKLWLNDNNMGDAGKEAVRDAVKDRSGFKLVLEIGDDEGDLGEVSSCCLS
eukprot:jgi/Chrpa1/19992/Chrysochromulina_OHIO_Genome00027191-RA